MDMVREKTYFPAVRDKRTTAPRHVDHDAFETSWSWWHFGASLGVGAGLLAGMLGFVLTTLAWFVGNELAVSSIGRVATLLIIGMIPLMMFGAHALDKIDAITDDKRIEYCKRNGLNDEQCE